MLQVLFDEGFGFVIKGKASPAWCPIRAPPELFYDSLRTAVIRKLIDDSHVLPRRLGVETH